MITGGVGKGGGERDRGTGRHGTDGPRLDLSRAALLGGVRLLRGRFAEVFVGMGSVGQRSRAGETFEGTDTYFILYPPSH